ncbi:14111_t:CDS:1, partial [Gigaspora margarita]
SGRFFKVMILKNMMLNYWLMSPPCQPYTCSIKGLDNQDLKAKG